MADKRVIVTELRVDTGQFAADLAKITSLLESVQKATQNTANSTQQMGKNTQGVSAGFTQLGNAANRAAQTMKQGFTGVGTQLNQITRASQTSSQSLMQMGGTASRLNTYLKAAFTGVIGQEILQMADSVYKADLRLKQVTKSSEDYASAQASVSRAMNTTFVDAETASKTYQRFSLAMEGTGRSAGDVAKAFEAVSLGARLAGSQGGELRSTLLQLTQALQANRLGGDELRSLMENAPVLTRAFAKELGTTTGALRDFGAQGKIGAETIINALLKNKDIWESENKKLGISFAEMWISVKNTFARTIENMFADAGVRDKISSFAKFVEDNAATIMKFIILLGSMTVIKFVVTELMALYSMIMQMGGAVLWLTNNFGLMATQMSGFAAAIAAFFAQLGPVGWALLAIAAGLAAIAAYKLTIGRPQEIKQIEDTTKGIETLDETLHRHQSVVDSMNAQRTDYTMKYVLDPNSKNKALADISELGKALGTQGALLEQAITKQSARLVKSVSLEDLRKVRSELTKMKVAGGTEVLDKQYAPKKETSAFGQKVEPFLDPAVSRQYLADLKKLTTDAKALVDSTNISLIDPEVTVRQLDIITDNFEKAGYASKEAYSKALYSSGLGQEQVVIVTANTEPAKKALEEMQKGFRDAGKLAVPTIAESSVPSLAAKLKIDTADTLKQVSSIKPVVQVKTNVETVKEEIKKERAQEPPVKEKVIPVRVQDTTKSITILNDALATIIEPKDIPITANDTNITALATSLEDMRRPYTIEMSIQDTADSIGEFTKSLLGIKEQVKTIPIKVDGIEALNEIKNIKIPLKNIPVTVNPTEFSTALERTKVPPTKIPVTADSAALKASVESGLKNMPINTIQVSPKKLLVSAKDIEVKEFKDKLNTFLEKNQPDEAIKLGELVDWGGMKDKLDEWSTSFKYTWNFHWEAIKASTSSQISLIKEIILSLIPTGRMRDSFTEFYRVYDDFLGKVSDKTKTWSDKQEGYFIDFIKDFAKESGDLLAQVEWNPTEGLRKSWREFMNPPKTASPTPAGAAEKGPVIGTPTPTAVNPVGAYVKQVAEEFKMGRSLIEKLTEEASFYQSARAERVQDVSKAIKGSSELVKESMENLKREDVMKERTKSTEQYLDTLRKIPGLAAVTAAELKKLGLSEAEVGPKDSKGEYKLPSFQQFRSTQKNEAEGLLEIQAKTMLSEEEAVSSALKLRDAYADVTESIITYKDSNTVMGSKTNETSANIAQLTASLTKYNSLLNEINYAQKKDPTKVPALQKNLTATAGKIQTLSTAKTSQGIPMSVYQPELVAKAVTAWKQSYKDGGKEISEYIRNNQPVKNLEKTYREVYAVPKGPYYQAKDVTALGYGISSDAIAKGAKTTSEQIRIANEMVLGGIDRDAKLVKQKQLEIDKEYYTQRISGYTAGAKQTILEQDTKPILKAETNLRQQELVSGRPTMDARANIGLMAANRDMKLSLLELHDELMKGKKTWQEYSEGMMTAYNRKQKFDEARAFKRIDVYTPGNAGAKASDQRIEDFAEKLAKLRKEGDSLNRGQYAMKLILEGDVKSKEGIYAVTKAAFAYVDAGERARSGWSAAWAQNDKDTAEATQRLESYYQRAKEEAEAFEAAGIKKQDGTISGDIVGSFQEAGGALMGILNEAFNKVGDTVKSAPSLYADKQQKKFEIDLGPQEQAKQLEDLDKQFEKLKEHQDPVENLFETFVNSSRGLESTLPKAARATGLLSQEIAGMPKEILAAEAAMSELNKTATITAAPKKVKRMPTEDLKEVKEKLNEDIKVTPTVNIDPIPLMLQTPEQLKSPFVSAIDEAFKPMTVEQLLVVETKTQNRGLAEDKMNKFNINKPEPQAYEPVITGRRESKDTFNFMDNIEKRSAAVAAEARAAVPIAPAQGGPPSGAGPAGAGSGYGIPAKKTQGLGESKDLDTSGAVSEVNKLTAAIDNSGKAITTWQNKLDKTEASAGGPFQGVRDTSQAVLGYGWAIEKMATSADMLTKRRSVITSSQEALNAQLDAGTLSWKNYQTAVINMKMENSDLFSGPAQAVLGMHAALDGVINRLPDMAHAVSAGVSEAFTGLSDAFVGFMDKGISASMQNFYDKMKEMIAKTIIEMYIMKPLAEGLQDIMKGGKKDDAAAEPGKEGGVKRNPQQEQMAAATATSLAATKLASASTQFGTAAQTGSQQIIMASAQLSLAAEKLMIATRQQQNAAVVKGLTGAFAGGGFGGASPGEQVSLDVTGTATGGMGEGIGANIDNSSRGIIPELADGGVVSGRTLAYVGEAGPEAIIPLDRFFSNSSAVAQGGGGNGGGNNTVININNTVSDKVEVKTRDSTADDGTHVIEIIVEGRIQEMFQSGAMDQHMSANYGITRPGKM